MGAGALVGVLLLLAARFGPNASRVDYMGALGPKHARLNALPSPKVVLIGGSNATFGFNSRTIEETLCRPVVNMSIHANLGFRFMVDEVKASFGEGDLVIAALEYSAYHEPIKFNDIHLLALDRNVALLKFLDPIDRPRALLGVAVLRLQAIWKVLGGAWKDHSPDKVYRANGFNVQGDLISHLSLPPFPLGDQERVRAYHPPISPDIWPIVLELNDSLERHHGTLVFTWPSMARSSADTATNNAILRALVEHGQHIVGDADDHIFADSAFYDTQNHLRSAGRQVRTNALLLDLCASGLVHCCIPSGSP